MTINGMHVPHRFLLRPIFSPHLPFLLKPQPSPAPTRNTITASKEFKRISTNSKLESKGQPGLSLWLMISMIHIQTDGYHFDPKYRY